MYPDELRYTTEPEWVRSTGNGTVVFGITDYAQEALGDIVYVSLPAVGATLAAGAPCGEVVARNESLDASPESVNSDAYGAGWMIELRPTSAGDLEELLTPADYRAIVEKE